MGHEGSGTIAAVGSAVTHLTPGDRVAIEPGYPCRRCPVCKAGRYNLCRGMKFAAAPQDARHGLLSKFFVMPADFVYKVSETVGLDEAVLVEPLAVGVHVVRLADVRPGQSVVVMGSGTIGLMCAAAAKAWGADRIIMVDIKDEKLKFASDVWGCEIFKSDADASAADNAQRFLAEFGFDEGVDIVLEASGAELSIQLGVHILQWGGCLIQAGLCKPDVLTPMLTVSEKELRVMGSFRYGSGDFEHAVRILEKGQVSVKPLISSMVPFEKAPEAWERTRKGEGIKNLIQGVP